MKYIVFFFKCQLFKSWGIEWQIKWTKYGSLGESSCNCKKIWGLWVTAMLKKGVFWALHTRHLQNGTAPPGLYYTPPAKYWHLRHHRPMYSRNKIYSCSPGLGGRPGTQWNGNCGNMPCMTKPYAHTPARTRNCSWNSLVESKKIAADTTFSSYYSTW